MKSTFHRALRLSAAGVLLTALSACSSDGSDSPRFIPNGVIFSDFVKDLFAADPATAEPTQINDINFAFLDENDPDAFNSQLE